MTCTTFWPRYPCERHERGPSAQEPFRALFHISLGSLLQVSSEEGFEGLSFELADASLTAELDQLGMLGHGHLVLSFPD